MRFLVLAAAALAVAATLPPAAAHPETPDCGLASDAGDSYNGASPIAIPVDCDAQLNDTWDSTDFYRVSCAMGQTVRATLTSASRTINLRAFGPVAVPYTLPPALDWDDTSGDGRADIRFTCTIGGAYRVQVLNGGLEQDLLDIPYHLTTA